MSGHAGSGPPDRAGSPGVSFWDRLDLAPPGTRQRFIDVDPELVNIRMERDAGGAVTTVYRYRLPEEPSSLGVVCVCGKAIATSSGSTAVVCSCGRVWVVTALQIAGP